MPFPQLRVFGLLADDGILHDGVAEVIHDRRDREDAAHETILRLGLADLRVRAIRTRLAQSRYQIIQ